MCLDLLGGFNASTYPRCLGIPRRSPETARANDTSTAAACLKQLLPPAGIAEWSSGLQTLGPGLLPESLQP